MNTLLHRAESHCSDSNSYKEEVELVEKVLIRNKYPPKLIKNIKRKRRNNQSSQKIEKPKPDATVVIPYVPTLSEKIIKIGKRANIRVVCKTSDTLRNRFVKFKPKRSTNKEVIYSIPCECGKEYIGETGRPLLTRVKEHKAALKKGETFSSKLVEHAWEMEHNFMWDEAKAIGKETYWKARKCHEALEIYIGGEKVISAPSMDLDPVWFPTLDDLKKSRNKKSTMTTVLRRSARIKTQQQHSRVENTATAAPSSAQRHQRPRAGTGNSGVTISRPPHLQKNKVIVRGTSA